MTTVPTRQPVEVLKLIALTLRCTEVASPVLDEPKFAVWSGSSSPDKHHYGKGGLAQHTMEVVELALESNKCLEALGKGVDPKHLFFACLYHDIGKLRDYKPFDDTFTDWSPTEHREQIGHLSRSALIWNQVAHQFYLYDHVTDTVTHAILAHHGAKTAGSPVTPKTTLAWLLHTADNLSARVDECNRAKPVE